MMKNTLTIQVLAILIATIISFFLTRWLEDKYEKR